MIDTILDLLMDILDDAGDDRELAARGLVGISLVLYGVYSVRPFIEEHIDARIMDLGEQIDDIELVDGMSTLDRFRRIIDILEAAGK